MACWPRGTVKAHLVDSVRVPRSVIDVDKVYILREGPLHSIATFKPAQLPWYAVGSSGILAGVHKRAQQLDAHSWHTICQGNKERLKSQRRAKDNCTASTLRHTNEQLTGRGVHKGSGEGLQPDTTPRECGGCWGLSGRGC
eukprot:4683722-Prymnesium_polylepis.4